MEALAPAAIGFGGADRPFGRERDDLKLEAEQERAHLRRKATADRDDVRFRDGRRRNQQSFAAFKDSPAAFARWLLEGDGDERGGVYDDQAGKPVSSS